ncbi:MAG: energy-coupling factor transporter transmembrane component T [Anaerovorax sp.]
MIYDPRTGLVVVFAVTSMALFCNSIGYLAPVLLVTLLISFLLNRNSLLGMVKRSRGMLGFFVVIALMQSLFQPTGKVLLSLWGWNLVTTGGLLDGVLFLLRILIIMVSASILAAFGARKTIQGFIEWKIPYELAFMTSIAIHFIPVFSEEMQNSLISIQLRGIDLKKISVKNRIKVYTYLFMPVVTSMIVRAKEMALAMEMRGFRMFPKRTSYLRLKLKPIDQITMGVVVVITMAVIGSYFLI